MPLRKLAIRVSETRGLLHQVNLRALRLYIKEHSEEELEKEIKGIEASKPLRALWEAGLSSGLQLALLERLEKIS